MEWRKITVHSDPAQEEVVSNILLEAGAQGVAVNGDWREDAAAVSWEEQGDETAVPYSVEAYYGAADSDGTAAEITRRLEGAFGQAPAVSAEVVDDAGWLEAWKKYCKPVRAGDHIVVKPTWCSYRAYPEDVVVDIDPGMAFGAGSHETTRMALRFLEQYLYPGNTLVDVGTGSGVLAIAAVKMGAGRVYALEVDPTAVRVARDNAAENGVDEVVHVIESDLLAELPEGTHVDLMVANIVADVIIRLVPDVGRFLRAGGMLICSGIVESRLASVLDALRRSGLRVIQAERDGEWCALAAKNKG